MKAKCAFDVSVNISICYEVTFQGDMNFQHLCENIKCCLAKILIYRPGEGIFKSLFINIKQLDALNFIISLFQASKCFEYMCSSSGGKIILYSLWYHHTCRWPSRAQIGAQNHNLCTGRPRVGLMIRETVNVLMCSKNAEAWNKLIIKFSASSCLISINKYIEMHGQQNIKKKTRI